MKLWWLILVIYSIFYWPQYWEVLETIFSHLGFFIWDMNFLLFELWGRNVFASEFPLWHRNLFIHFSFYLPYLWLWSFNRIFVMYFILKTYNIAVGFGSWPMPEGTKILEKYDLLAFWIPIVIYLSKNTLQNLETDNVQVLHNM